MVAGCDLQDLMVNAGTVYNLTFPFKIEIQDGEARYPVKNQNEFDEAIACVDVQDSTILLTFNDKEKQDDKLGKPESESDEGNEDIEDEEDIIVKPKIAAIETRAGRKSRANSKMYTFKSNIDR